MSSLRSSESSASTSTGLLAIDQLLAVFQNPGKPCHQRHFSNWVSTNSSPLLSNPVKGFIPPVLEITSVSHCSGKTQLLYLIITVALLPKFYNDIPLNGKSSAIILLDLSSKFSILRLRDVITSYIISCVSACKSIALPSVEISFLVQTSLVHLHVFRPQSSLSLLTTISSLPSYFFSQSALHQSSGRKISSLVLNDLGAFIWQDRLPCADSTTVINEQSSDESLVQNYRLLVSSLKSIQSTFSCLIIATSSSLSTPYNLSGNHLALRRQTPAIWNNFCTTHIVIERINVPKFGPGISAQEAEYERAKRQEVVKRGERRGWINWRDSEGWREEVKEGLQKWERECGLRFSVGEGVEIKIQE